MHASTGRIECGTASIGLKNKKPRPKPRKNLQIPLTNGERYDKMAFHTGEYDDLVILSNVDILPQIVAAVKYKTCKN